MRFDATSKAVITAPERLQWPLSCFLSFPHWLLHGSHSAPFTTEFRDITPWLEALQQLLISLGENDSSPYHCLKACLNPALSTLTSPPTPPSLLHLLPPCLSDAGQEALGFACNSQTPISSEVLLPLIRCFI